MTPVGEIQLGCDLADPKSEILASCRRPHFGTSVKRYGWAPLTYHRGASPFGMHGRGSCGGTINGLQSTGIEIEYRTLNQAQNSLPTLQKGLILYCLDLVFVEEDQNNRGEHISQQYPGHVC